MYSHYLQVVGLVGISYHSLAGDCRCLVKFSLQLSHSNYNDELTQGRQGACSPGRSDIL